MSTGNHVMSTHLGRHYGIVSRCCLCQDWKNGLSSLQRRGGWSANYWSKALLGVGSNATRHASSRTANVISMCFAIYYLCDPDLNTIKPLHHCMCDLSSSCLIPGMHESPLSKKHLCHPCHKIVHWGIAWKPTSVCHDFHLSQGGYNSMCMYYTHTYIHIL